MFLQIVLNFFIGLFVGFILEFVYRSIEHKKLIKPKLIDAQMYALIGTFLAIISFLEIALIYRLILIFIVPTLVEFLTGYLDLKIKKVRLWDYSHEKFNFMGLICLRFSLYWFLISLIYYHFILPLF
ncbi:MAG: putative ABC transporter permease [Burkholderiales bacterium]|nr:putative ABC transporter permease [Burkholderiales bacterium]